MIEEPGILRGSEFVPAATLRQRASRGATAMRQAGVQRGDTVALLMRNDHPFFEAAFAASMLGASPVPVNWHGKPEEIAYVLSDCTPKVLIVHADLLRPILGHIPAGIEVRVVPTPPDIGEAYAIPEKEWATPEGHIEWSAWIAASAPFVEAPQGAPAAMLYTSGTTGRPKAVHRPSLTPEQRQASPYHQDVARFSGLVPGVRAVVTGPLYHGAPLAWGLGWAQVNGFVVLQPKFDPEELLRLIEEQAITNLLVVPVMFNRLLKLPPETRARYDVSSLRHVTHGAAPCPRHVKTQMIEWWGPVIFEQYGSAEIGLVTGATSEQWLAHPGTVGKPLAGAEIRILDSSGQQLPVGEVGEVYARVADLPDFTYAGASGALTEDALDGFRSAGDVGYLDSDGFLYLCDRKKDMVISGGVNIYPIEIEECLLALPGVRDVAVFGIPDEEYGEALAAAIELDGTRNLTADEVRAHVRATLAGLKTPRVVEFFDALPRDDTGKLYKRKLREKYWAEAGRAI